MFESFHRSKKSALLIALFLLASCGKGCQKETPPAEAAKTEATKTEVSKTAEPAKIPEPVKPEVTSKPSEPVQPTESAKAGDVLKISGLEPLDLIPARMSSALFYVNAKKLQGVSMVQDFIKTDPNLASNPFAKAALDRGFESEMIGGVGTGKDNALFLLRNQSGTKSFTTDIASFLEKDASVVKEVLDGKSVYQWVQSSPFLPTPSGKKTVIAFTDSGAILGAPSNEVLKSVFDLAEKKGESVRSQKELVELFNQHQNRLLWVVVSGKNMGPDFPHEGTQDLKMITFGIDYNTSFLVEVSLYAKDATSAEKLLKDIEKFKKEALSDPQAPLPPMIKEIVSKMKAEQKAAVTKISVEISEAQMKELPGLFMQAMMGGMAAPPEELTPDDLPMDE